MIGIKAIPAQSGGFETAVDEISRGLVRLGHDVVVYNRSGMSDYSFSEYEGVRLVTLPTLKSKNLSTIVHALLSTIHLIFHRVDVVHYFITGTTLFAPIPRLLGMKVVCSVDGTDWQRSKWGRFARWYLRFSERLAVLFCHRLVGDSRDVVRYYREVYGVSPSLITYGIRETTSEGLEWLERFALKPREYVLFVGRLVPENNIHQLIQAFERTTTDKKLVIVGHDPWEKEYVRSLKSTQDSRIIFTGGVYGIGYAQLQRNAYLFVLPDEVGGTHPALVEAMGFGNCVLVNDTPSNLEVIADAGFSYCGKEGFQDLRRQLQTLLDDRSTVEEFRLKAERRARANYNWEHVVGDHANLYVQLLTGTEVVDSNSVRVNVNTSATRDLTQIHREQEFVVGRKTATGSGPTLNEASK
jgi:glycosyltransferase involved in cell wall biosynthesis